MKSIVVFILLTIVIANALTPGDSSPVRIGLALSGGGALGFAHIGVLKVFEEEGIPISFISGISMGSLVGGIYAAGYSATEIESIATNADWSIVFSSNPPFSALYLAERQQTQRYIIRLRHRNFFPALPSGLVRLQYVEFLLMHLLSEIEYNTYFDFDSLTIPYRAVAVDLVTGKKIIIKNGRLTQAIRASIAIPGVYAPEILDNKELVDGGVQQYLPVDPLLEEKPDFKIAVLTMKRNPEPGASLIDVVSRTMNMASIEDLNRQKQLADVLIEPNVDPFQPSDFARASELIAAGEAAARVALPQIFAKLAGRKRIAQRKKVEPRTLPLIHSVRFEGLVVTQPRLVYNEIKTRSGNFLDFNRLINDMNRLFNTRLFENINYRLNFTGQDWVDVIIELKERAYGFYNLGLRYDNIDNVGLGIEIGQGNLWGSGASVRGVIQWGNPNEYRLGFTGTSLYRLPFGYRLDAFWSSIDHSYYEKGKWLADYNYDRRGGVFEAGYILGLDGYFNIGVKAYQAMYRMPTLQPFDSIPKLEWVIGPTLLMEFNNYNDLFLPTRGQAYYLAAFLASRKLKSTNDFLKIDFSTERIIPLSSWFLLRYGLELGMSWGKLAWSEYFHSGGENLAGFTKNEFTARQKAILRFGSEFRLFRLFNRDDYPFYLQLFSNISSFQKLSQLVNNPQIDSALNWGLGIGVRTNTPFGPLQFILGVADFAKPKPLPTTKINAFFSVGRDFRYFKD
jgi:predicted acylesterase/phospholipase RssA